MVHRKVKSLPQALFTSVQLAEVVKPDLISLPVVRVLVTPSNVTDIVLPAAQGLATHPAGLAESTPKKQLIEMVPV